MSVEHERLVRMLKESISLMCKSSLNYDIELNVEGLLGITLDKRDVVLININESFQTENSLKSAKRRQEQNDEVKEVKEEGEPSSTPRKKKSRRRSRDSSGRDESSRSSHNIAADFELPEFSRRSQTGMEHPSNLNMHSKSQKDHTESSRDGQILRASAADTSKDDSDNLIFDEIVIKEEIDDEADGENTEDFSFTGDGFVSDQQLYSSSVPVSGLTEGALQVRQYNVSW